MHGCSLKDILYKKRMERQLAAARGLGPMGERPPDEDGAGGIGGIPTAGSKARGSACFQSAFTMSSRCASYVCFACHAEMDSRMHVTLNTSPELMFWLCLLARAL